MGWLSQLFQVAAPAVGTLLGGPVGGAIGSAVGGGVGLIESNNAIRKAEKAQEAARNANLQRYNQIIAEYTANRDRARSLNDQVSRQDLADIQQQFGDLRSNTAANLGARGLANTTIPISIYQGIAREQAGAVNRANDNRLQRTIKIDSDLTGELARAIERRTDTGPSEQTMERLAAAAGQAQSALGGGLKSVIEEMMKPKAKQTLDPNQFGNRYAPAYFGNLTAASSRPYFYGLQ